MIKTLLKTISWGLAATLALTGAGVGQAQIPTVKVPQCLMTKDDVKIYVPCTGVVPVDTTTGNALKWTDLFDRITANSSGGTGGGTPTGPAGSPNASVVSVQGVTNGAPVITSTTITTPLPAFAATPTFNIGLINGIATAAKQDALLSALGSPFQAGASIGNTFFGARLQDSAGSAFGTAGNPIYVSGNTNGNVPVSPAGSPNPSVLTVQGITNGTPLGTKLLDTSGAPFGTSGNPIYVSGGSGGASATGTAGSPNSNVTTVQGITGGTAIPVSVTASVLPTNAATAGGQTNMLAKMPDVATNNATIPSTGILMMGNGGGSSRALNTNAAGELYTQTNIYASVLPTNAATASNQTTMNTNLTTIGSTVAATGASVPANTTVVGVRDPNGLSRTIASDTRGGLVPAQGVVATTRTSVAASTATALETAGVTNRIGASFFAEANLTATVYICTTQTTSCSATNYDFIIPNGTTAGTPFVPIYPSITRYYAFTTAAVVLVENSWVAQ